MTKLLFSVRITEKYFSAAEIKSLETELDSFNSKSEFMRKIIKFYLEYNDSKLKSEDKVENLEDNLDIDKLKDLVEENNVLLKDILNNKVIQSTNKITKVAYQGQEQENKTNQALSLLDKF